MLTDEEKKKKLLEYMTLRGQKTLKSQEMERIEKELGLTREKATELGQELLMSDFEEKKD